MRPDIIIEDIAPNIRYVSSIGIHAVTIDIDEDEAEEFKAWATSLGLEISSHFSFESNRDTFILATVSRETVMLIKLTWGRYEA